MHSLISATKMNNVSIKSSTRKLDVFVTCRWVSKKDTLTTEMTEKKVERRAENKLVFSKCLVRQERKLSLAIT